MQAGLGALLGQRGDPVQLAALGQLRQARDDHQHGPVAAAPADRAAAHRAQPLLGLGQDGTQAVAIGGRRRHQAGILEGVERGEHVAATRAVDRAYQQRTGGRGGQQPEQHAADQAEHPGVTGVRVDRQVPGAEQRDDGRESGIVEGLGHPDADELRRIRSTQWGGGGLRVQRRAEPAGGEQARGGPQLLSQMVLLERIGGSRAERVERRGGRIDDCFSLPVQGSGLIDPGRRLCHRLTSCVRTNRTPTTPIDRVA